MLTRLLPPPSIRDIPLGSPSYFNKQREVLFSKPLVKASYDLWYKLIREDVHTTPLLGEILELGSGSSYLKEFIPELLTSDVQEGIAEYVIDARELPFEENSLRAICLTHVFHHIPDIHSFLSSATRCLKPGGVISLIDCADTPLARFFFSHFHPEPYIREARDWNFTSCDAMLSANQALTGIVFKRDKKQFFHEFPDLAIETIEYLPSIGYLLQGGVTLRNCTPSFITPIIRALDKLTYIRPLISLHWHIRLRKKSHPAISK